MTQPTRWNLIRPRANKGLAPTLEGLEDRVVLSTAGVADAAAEVSPLRNRSASLVVHGYQTASAAAAATALDAHVALGDGVGAKQVIVENWNNVPFVFLINTNDELYYGYQTSRTATTAPWNAYTSFSGWTFVTGAAKTITVDMSRDGVPYIYLINSKNDLYYGHLSIASSGSVLPSNLVNFSGWTFLTPGAKDLVVNSWNGSTYLYLINTNDDLYFGSFYTTGGSVFPPVASQTLFSGWNFITGAAKSLDVNTWRGYAYLYLINANDELYYGNLYFGTDTPAVPEGHASFSGWTFVTGAADSVDVAFNGSNPRLYLINWNHDLYYADLTAAGSDDDVPPGPSKLSDWTFVTGGAKQVVVDTWQGNTYYYLINTNDELYYGYWYTTYVETVRWTYTPVNVFSGWNFITGAAQNVTVNQWQNKPFLYLTNSLDDLYFANLYTAVATVAPWNSYVAFSGWSPF